MQQRIELFGIARLIAGRKELTVSLPDGATVGDALRALAHECPSLLDSVLTSQGEIVEGSVLSLGGREFVTDRATRLPANTPLLVLPTIAGG
jgi:molybdopterin converting factor small subunit